jgi:hypothetical protein
LLLLPPLLAAGQARSRGRCTAGAAAPGPDDGG